MLNIPTNLRQEVLSLYQDIPDMGHQGWNRTMEWVKSKNFCYGLSTEVANNEASCHHYNVNKKSSKTSRHELLKFHAGAPMKKVHLDIFGSLPKTQM